MAYKVDTRDVQFTLFEHLKIQNLKNFEAFAHLAESDYQMLSEEALKLTQKEIAPLEKKSDEFGCHLKDGILTTPPVYKEAYQAYAASGFNGADVPTTLCCLAATRAVILLK